MANPNTIKVIYNPNFKSIKFKLYENDECIDDNPEELKKYSTDTFELSSDTLNETFFYDISKMFNVPKVNVVFSTFENQKIYYDLFKLSVNNFNNNSNADNFLKVAEMEILTDSTTVNAPSPEVKTVTDNQNTETNHSNSIDTSNLSELELARIEQAMDYFYELDYDEEKQPDACPEGALKLLEPIFQNHKDDDYVLSCYLPIFMQGHEFELDVVEKLLNSLDSDLLSVKLAYVDLYLRQRELSLAEEFVNKAVEKYPNSVLAKCYKVLVLLGAYGLNNDTAALKEAEKIAGTLSGGNTKLERSWVVKIGQLLQTRQGKKAKQISEEECEDKDLYTSFLDISGGYSVGFSVFYESTKIQDAINCAENGEGIFIHPGIYKEALTIDKNISLVSIAAVICVPLDKTCFISSDAKIEAISFTNDENLTLDELDKEIKSGEFAELPDFLESDKAVITITGNATLKNVYVTRGYGGGIDIIGNSQAVIDSCCIYNNKEHGISVMDNANPVISNDDDYMNIFENPIGIDFIGNATGECRNLNIFCNTVGVQCNDSSRPNFSNCNLENNILTGIGYLDNASGSFENCAVVYELEEKSENLTGIFISNTATPKIEDCQNISGFNLGITVWENANPNISDCTVSNCSICGLGIGDNAAGTYTNCLFTDNYTTDKDGNVSTEIGTKGIIISGNSIAKFNNCRSTQNIVGIIIDGDNPQPQITNCSFDENYYGIRADSGNPIFRDITVNGNFERGVMFTGDIKGRLENFEISNSAHFEKEDDGTETGAVALIVGDTASPYISSGKITNNFKGLYIDEKTKTKFLSSVIVAGNRAAGENMSKTVDMSKVQFSNNTYDFYDKNAPLWKKAFDLGKDVLEVYTKPFEVAYNGLEKLNDFFKQR